MTLRLSEKLYNAKIEWSKASKLASYLEEMRKPVLASEVISAKKGGEKTMSMCEYIAYNSTEYKRHIEAMTEAKEQANIKFAHYQRVVQEIEEEKQQSISANVERKYAEYKGD